MGVSVPLKLKDSAGLQSINTVNYDFLAYRAGLQLVGLDSNDVAGYGIRDANTDKRDIGDIINTFYDSATGTHGPDALFSTTSITTNLYQGTGTLEYTDSNYRNFVYQTDSANDSGSQQILQAFTDDDWTTLNSNIVSRMVKEDYPGVIYLGDSDFDSANGSWSKLISNFYSDTRTSGDAVNYHIWQKQYLTDNVPSDSAKPFTMKYRTDSAEINVAGAFKDIGRDSDFVYSKSRYYPSSPGVRSLASFNRAALTFTGFNATTQEFDSYSSLYLSLDKEWNDKIYGVWQRANGPAGRGPKDFLLKNFQQTQFSTVSNQSSFGSNYGDKIHDNASANYVYKDSAGDTASHRLGSRPQVWLGVKGRVNLVDSDRFGDSAATFAATDATMQSLVESDGKWSFLFNFDSNATFKIRKVSDGIFIGGEGGSEGVSSGVTYIYDSEGVDNLTNNNLRGFSDYSDVAVMRPGWNYFQFPGQFGNKGSIIPDSSTNQLISHTRTNGNYFASLFSSIPTNSNYGGIGLDSADEINLVLNNDFQGFQIADSDQLDETLNKRVRNYLADTTSVINPPIGTYMLRSSGDGTPSQSGILGTWQPKGVATDFRNQIIDVNYTRTSTTVFDRVRSSSFTSPHQYYDGNYEGAYNGYIGNYVTDYLGNIPYLGNYGGQRTSNFTDGFLGNYLGNYTRERDENFDRTRTSSYVGQYIGNYTGNYAGTFGVSAISSIGSGSYPRTIIQTASVPAGNYTGDGGTGYVGSGGSETARTIVVDETIIPPASTTVSNGDSFTIRYTVSGFPATVQTASGSVFRNGRTFPLGQGTNISSDSLNARFNVTIDGVQYTNVPYTNSNGSSSATWAGGNVTINVSGSTTYSISSQTAGTGWSNNAATIDASTGRVSSPVQTKSSDFSRDYDGNYDGNYSTDYEGNYTGDFLGNYEGQFERTTTADYTGDFLGNYDGEYSTDYEGNYEGAYNTDYEGNYEGDFTGNYTGNYDGAYLGTYTRYSTVNLGSEYGNNPLGPPGEYRWIVNQFGQIDIIWDGSYVVNNYSMGGFSTPTLYVSSIFGVDTSPPPLGSYDTYNKGSYITGGNFSSDYSVSKVANYASGFVGNYGSKTSTRDSTRNSTSTYQRTRTSSYTGIYDRTRTSLFEGTYTRERDTNFQSGDAYSSVYTAQYEGNYVGNYTSDYAGNYVGNFTGDFIGTTIDTDKSGDAYETFTLYVRTD